MCPGCLATAVLIAGGAASAAGLVAVTLARSRPWRPDASDRPVSESREGEGRE
jgi:hypothetical protein